MRRPSLIFVTPEDTVGAALERMSESGVTQIPVLEENRSVGSLRESRVLTKLLNNRELIDSKVREVMDESFPVIEMETSLARDQIETAKSSGRVNRGFQADHRHHHAFGCA